MTTLSRRIAEGCRKASQKPWPAQVVSKAKVVLLDYLSCAYESLDLPWSRQAAAMAGSGSISVIGHKDSSSAEAAAFVNAILGHGLVREDMHTGSVSHLGVVVIPTLLALAEDSAKLGPGRVTTGKVTGRAFINGIVCGYEVGAVIGKALMDADNVRIFRPTGVTGPLGATVGGARMLGLDTDTTVSALGLAANTTAGLNEWPYSGADDMFFHVGFAARNAVTAVKLAMLGARGSESALDGKAGLFTAMRHPDRSTAVNAFQGAPEILSVYHKPAPACNYAQTSAQAALALGVRSKDIVAIQVKVTGAALNYPGCNATGPFERILAAKMSIHYCVAATLASGIIAESNYRKLGDKEIARLMKLIVIEEDPALTAAYPALQGAEVTVRLRNGKTLTQRLADVIPASEEQIRTRFRLAAAQVLGAGRAAAIEKFVDTLETCENVANLGPMLAAGQRK